MQATKTTFFAIIGVAILICVAMMATSYFLVSSFNLTTEPENLEIQIVVAPSLKDWATQSAQDFNEANPTTQIKIIEANELIPVADFQTNNPQGILPSAWLAEATYVLDMAQKSGLQFEDAQSVASTSLSWGGFDNKLETLNLANSNLTWQNINTLAKSADGLKLVIADPQDSAEGLAALISATASQSGNNSLSANDVSTADTWLNETFGNRNTRIPATPGGDFATKGVSAGDVGILTLASWLDVKMNEKPGFTMLPTQPNVVLDYPFAIRSTTSPEAKEAALAFRQFLLEEAQQIALNEVSLDPAGVNQGGVQIDGNAALRLLDGTNRWLQ